MKPPARCAPAQLATIVAVAIVAGVAALVSFSDAGPVPAPTPVDLWGVALGLHPQASLANHLEYPPSLEPVHTLGARAVLLAVPLVQTDLHSHDIEPGPDTPSPDDLRAMIRGAHRLGLSVALMPFIVLKEGADDAWRGRLRPSDLHAWWRSYGAQIKTYAVLAAHERVAVLIIGSELSSLSVDAKPWVQLAGEVRSVYGGQLALVANHDALDLRAPFEAVDLAGVSAYFPLSDDINATQEDLRRGWARSAKRLRAFAEATAKPLVIFEVGYPSVDGGAVRPWDTLSGGPVDLEEQRRAYVAATEALAQLPLAGVFFWTWFGPGGPHDRHYTPRNKPAQAVLRRFFRSRSSGS